MADGRSESASTHPARTAGSVPRSLLVDCDAALTHPFFSLHATFRSIRFTFDLTQDDPVFDSLRDVYLAPWTHFAPLDELRQIFRLAQRLAPILAALRWLPALSLLAGDMSERYEAAVPNLMREFLRLNSE